MEPVRTVTAGSTGPEGKLVDVGAYDLYIECAGSGSPTVILEYGLDSTAADWSAVMGEIAVFTRVCVYDRAGVGRSQPAPAGQRDSQMMVDDLQRLTVAAGLTPPFVLVGHSFGGLNARLFTFRHPDVVAGLVLIDSVHPDQLRRWQEALPTPVASGSPALPRPLIVPDVPGNEQVDLARSLEQARAATLGERLPLVVLTAGQLPELASFSDELARRLYEVHLALQQELAQLSSNSVHVVATGSGHAIQRNQSYLVATAVHQVVIAARNEISELPPCDLIYPPLNAECQRVPRQ